MEVIGATACAIIAATAVAAFIWVCVATSQNEDSISRLWDENRKLKDRVFDLENKPARKTK